MSPVLRLAPSTNTGRYTLEPLLRFLISQFPPFSLPGIVLAASFAILSHSGLPSLSYQWVIVRGHGHSFLLLGALKILQPQYKECTRTAFVNLKWGIVRSTFPRRHPLADGKFASGLECRTSQSLSVSRPFSRSALSLSYHISSNSFDGAVPTTPG